MQFLKNRFRRGVSPLNATPKTTLLVGFTAVVGTFGSLLSDRQYHFYGYYRPVSEAELSGISTVLYALLVYAVSRAPSI